MDVCYIRIFIYLIALSKTRSTLSIYRSYQLELHQNVSAISSFPHTSEEPIQLSSNKSRSSNLFLDPLFITSEETPKNKPELLDLLSNNTHKQPGVNITPSSSREFSVMGVKGTIERRQARPKYFDILYSKPPNRFYAKQVATYGTGSNEPTSTPVIVMFNNTCDYDAYYCLKIYTTGVVCARTIYYEYHTFPNYCLMEYTNCFYRQMGYGFYEYPYMDNTYLKSIRIIEDVDSMPIDLY